MNSLVFLNGYFFSPTGDRTKYAAQDSCTKFFECYDNKIEENECPKGTFFDKSKI